MGKGRICSCCRYERHSAYLGALVVRKASCVSTSEGKPEESSRRESGYFWTWEAQGKEGLKGRGKSMARGPKVEESQVSIWVCMAGGEGKELSSRNEGVLRDLRSVTSDCRRCYLPTCSNFMLMEMSL